MRGKTFSEKITKYEHTKVSRTSADDEDSEFQLPPKIFVSGESSRPTECVSSAVCSLSGSIEIDFQVSRQISSESRQGLHREILSTIILDDGVRGKRTSRVMHAQDAAHVQAKTEFARILDDDMGGILQTVNHDYADALNVIGDERVRATLKQMGL
ncbi:hypothetical protein BDW66DRAFT_154188 [Aspergillus desertorum]